MTGPRVDAVPAASPAKPMNTRVLVVDDQQQIHDDFREMLLPRRTTAASDDLVAAFMDPPSHRSGPALPPCEARSAGRRRNAPGASSEPTAGRCCSTR